MSFLSDVVVMGGMDDSSSSGGKAKRKLDVRSSRARQQFFNELRELLNDKSLSHALWWQDGTVVIDPEPFERDVIRKCFAAKKFGSFQRRLNRW